ncbi:MAG: alpha/beta fold hydrolase [Bacteroidales bacterium]|nr:alpha/beta fold hydrolase [Bacteroidales bacterium]MCF8402440.1 alpha/beta fold hydrolase [Bacteroidales bacterium]
MQYLFIILLLFIIISFILLILVSRTYVVKATPHKKTPAEFLIPFKEIKFRTKNNCQLYGWWIPQEKEASQCNTIILVHGWKRNVGRLLPYIEPLYNAGFNLLAFDVRNHGSSDVDGVSSMPRFTEDILSAVDFLQSIPGFEKATPGIVGLSMGGAAAIYAATHDIRISKVATVGAFARPQDVMRREMEKKYIPYYPFGWIILEYAQYKIGQRFKTFAPVNNIMKLDVPLLLIHGEMDETTPFAQAKELYDASRGKAKLWSLPNQGHSNCHHHPGFWEGLIAFLYEKR